MTDTTYLMATGQPDIYAWSPELGSGAAAFTVLAWRFELHQGRPMIMHEGGYLAVAPLGYATGTWEDYEAFVRGVAP